MKSIATLVPDMYELLVKQGGWFSDDLSHSFSEDVASRLRLSLNPPPRKPALRLSQMGPKCPLALWYSFHHPELAVPLPPWTMFKFSYGHILEALAITVAKGCGHEVVGEQDELRVDGIVGHRDCIIDGCLFDIKSSSSRGMAKFQNGTLWQDDSFGYLEQLDGYLCGSLGDPLLKVKDRAYILAIDLQLGHMCTYEHKYREDHILRRVREYKQIVGRTVPPKCECRSVADGESGNYKLDVPASYSAYKYACNPALRTFLYANGPRFLTKVVRRPLAHVIEIDKHGNRVS